MRETKFLEQFSAVHTLPQSVWIIIFWAGCFRIVYREVKEDEGSGHEVGGESTPVLTLYSRGSRDVGTLSSTTSPSTPVPGTPSMSCTVEDVLQLLRHLFVISTFRDDVQNTGEGEKHIYTYSREKHEADFMFPLYIQSCVAEQGYVLTNASFGDFVRTSYSVLTQT